MLFKERHAVLTTGRKRRADLINLVFCLAMIGLIIIHTIYYAWAVRFLQNVDLKSRGDLSGAIFFGTPKHLSVGQEISRDRLIEFLKHLNFSENSDPNRGGTYHSYGRRILRISSRFKEFPSLSITFQRGHITRIQDLSGSDLAEAELEPETLATFVETIKGEDNTKNFLARRRVVHAQDVLDTDLFFAIMASEDATFMEHHGLRYLHLLLSVFQGRGGSSISAQVIKNAVAVDSSYSFLRKLNEIYLTVAMEQRLSKAQIFELYVNHAYLGSIEGDCSLYGYLAAANEYFNKSTLKDLTLSEASVLAGMTDGPNRYLHKIRDGDYSRITERRDRVLRLLHKNWPDRYSDDVIEAARREPVRFVFTSKHTETKQLDEISRAFVDFTKSQPAMVPLTKLPAAEYSGLHVYTSIDSDLMRAALKALNTHLPAIERKFPPVKEQTEEPVQDRLLGTLIAIDPRSGEIVTMVGTAAGDHGLSYAKLAINALAPPASTIKPLLNSLALSGSRLPSGERYTSATIIDPQVGQAGGWTPNIGVAREPMRVRTCLSRSDDGCAAYTLNLIGLKSAGNFYYQVTGSNPSPLSGLLAIGFGSQTEISTLDEVCAYSIFSNDGVPAIPTSIHKVFQNGQQLSLPQSERRLPVVSPGAAFITAQMMRSTLGSGYDGSVGTARNAQFARTFLRANPEMEMGGKTGSGPNNLWMVSVSPRLVVAVLLTYEHNSKFRNARSVIAADTATVIWSDFMNEISRSRRDLLVGRWTRPPNVQALEIDPARGCLSENGIEEYFLDEALPKRCE